MKIETVAAGDVRVGDRIYDPGYYAPDKWVPVKKISRTENGLVVFDVGYCQMGFLHERQGMCRCTDE